MVFFVKLRLVLLLSTQIPAGFGTWVDKKRIDYGKNEDTNKIFVILDTAFLRAPFDEINSSDNMRLAITDKYVSSYTTNRNGDQQIVIINLVYTPDALNVNRTEDLALFLPCIYNFSKVEREEPTDISGFPSKFGGPYRSDQGERRVVRGIAQESADAYLKTWLDSGGTTGLPDPLREQRPPLLNAPEGNPQGSITLQAKVSSVANPAENIPAQPPQENIISPVLKLPGNGSKVSGKVKPTKPIIHLPYNPSSQKNVWEDRIAERADPKIFETFDAILLGGSFDTINANENMNLNVKDKSVISYAIDTKIGRGIVIINVVYKRSPGRNDENESLTIFVPFQSVYCEKENAITDISGCASKFGGPYFKSEYKTRERVKVEGWKYLQGWNLVASDKVEKMPMLPTYKRPENASPKTMSHETAPSSPDCLKPITLLIAPSETVPSLNWQDTDQDSSNGRWKQILEFINETFADDYKIIRRNPTMPNFISKMYAASIAICQINGMVIVHFEYSTDAEADNSNYVSIYLPLMGIRPDGSINRFKDVRTNLGHFGGQFISPLGIPDALNQAKVAAAEFYNDWAGSDFSVLPRAKRSKHSPIPSTANEPIPQSNQDNISSSSSKKKVGRESKKRFKGLIAKLKTKSADTSTTSASGNVNSLRSESVTEQNQNLRHRSHGGIEESQTTPIKKGSKLLQFFTRKK